MLGPTVYPLSVDRGDGAQGTWRPRAAGHPPTRHVLRRVPPCPRKVAPPAFPEHPRCPLALSVVSGALEPRRWGRAGTRGRGLRSGLLAPPPTSVVRLPLAVFRPPDVPPPPAQPLPAAPAREYRPYCGVNPA